MTTSGGKGTAQWLIVNGAENAASESGAAPRGMSRRDIAIAVAMVLVVVAIAIIFVSIAGAADPMTGT